MICAEYSWQHQEYKMCMMARKGPAQLVLGAACAHAVASVLCVRDVKREDFMSLA